MLDSNCWFQLWVRAAAFLPRTTTITRRDSQPSQKPLPIGEYTRKDPSKRTDRRPRNREVNTNLFIFNTQILSWCCVQAKEQQQQMIIAISSSGRTPPEACALGIVLGTGRRLALLSPKTIYPANIGTVKRNSSWWMLGLWGIQLQDRARPTFNCTDFFSSWCWCIRRMWFKMNTSNYAAQIVSADALGRLGKACVASDMGLRWWMGGCRDQEVIRVRSRFILGQFSLCIVFSVEHGFVFGFVRKQYEIDKETFEWHCGWQRIERG